MNDFRRLSDQVWASAQITEAEVAAAARDGFAMIINNRPEGEVPDQTTGERIAAAAADCSVAYRAIPITHSGFSHAQVEAMAQALAEADGPVLAYCRSGTRSTLLWALAQAQVGSDIEAITQAAAEAGYDISPIRSTMDMLAAQSRR